MKSNIIRLSIGLVMAGLSGFALAGGCQKVPQAVSEAQLKSVAGTYYLENRGEFLTGAPACIGGFLAITAEGDRSLVLAARLAGLKLTFCADQCEDGSHNSSANYSVNAIILDP